MRVVIIGLFVLIPCLALAQSPDDLQRQQEKDCQTSLECELEVQRIIAQENYHKANAREYMARLQFWRKEAQRLAQENEALKQELEEQEACEPSSSD